MKNISPLLILILCASSALASTVSYVGNLDPDDPNSVALYQFSLASTANLNIQTWGYGGGTNGAGAVIPAGGFDPYISLFAGAGDSATFVTSNDDGLCPPGNGLVACEDSTLNLNNLAAGTYTVALTAFENMSFAENQGSGALGDGFIGLGNYYDSASDSVRSAAYAIDISSPAIIPEPSMLGLALLAVFFAAVTQRQRLFSSKG